MVTETIKTIYELVASHPIHATVYMNYDGYATYSMTFKPKAKVGLMTAAKNFCQKSRGYAKIGIGSQYGLAKISFDFACDRQIGICGG